MTRSAPTLTHEQFNEICLQIEHGKGLNHICKEMHISYSTVTANIRNSGEFAEMYARAREIQADYLAEEAQALLDEPPKMKYDQFGHASIDPAWVQLQKNRAEQRKWHAGKLRPKVYGDSTTVKGDKDNPLFNFADALIGAREALQHHRDEQLQIEDKNTTIEGQAVDDGESPI